MYDEGPVTKAQWWTLAVMIIGAAFLYALFSP